MSVELWHLLHDGTIIRLNNLGANSVAITIRIPYLRHMFSPDGESIIIRLDSCTHYEYQPLDSDEGIDEPLRIADEQPEIRRAWVEDDHLHVECGNGDLRLTYESYALFLIQGTPLPLPSLRQTVMRIGKRGKNGTSTPSVTCRRRSQQGDRNRSDMAEPITEGRRPAQLHSRCGFV